MPFSNVLPRPPAPPLRVMLLLLAVAGLALLSCSASLPAKPRPSVRLELLPVSGVPGEDLVLDNYFDHGSAGAPRDYRGGRHTYAGHPGSDYSILGFEQMDAGVPVYAAQAGRVTETHDGETDRNTKSNPGSRGNGVTIDHGSFVTSYGHLKRGSVRVRVGQRVLAGEQIAMVGSSGNSSWPHLHFNVIVNGRRVDPYSENPGRSLWAEQHPYEFPARIADVGFKPERSPGPPQRQTRMAYLPVGQRGIKFWMIEIYAFHRAAPLERKWHWYAPNGRLNWNWDQTVKSDYYIGRPYWGLGGAKQTGDWRVQVTDAGRRVVDLTVRAGEGRLSNRPPLEPQVRVDYARGSRSVLECRIVSDQLNRDPDLDFVKYEYSWLQRGRLLRRAVSAGRRDFLPAPQSPGGVQCRVVAVDSAGARTAAAAASL